MAKKRKTIVFLETGTQGGGSFVSLFQYLQRMDRTAFRPVVCFVAHTPFVEKIKQLDIPVFVFSDPLYIANQDSKRQFLRALQRGVEIVLPAMRPTFDRHVHAVATKGLMNVLKRERADLLVTNVQIDRDGFALDAARALSIPVVSHLRSTIAPGFAPSTARIANRDVVTFVANSKATRSYWTEKQLDEDRVKVVYNAVEPQPERSVSLRREFSIPDEVRVISCIGRYVHIKGQDLLIRAAAQIADEFPRVCVLLMGDGIERENLQQLARECDMEDRVIFAGWRDDVRELVAASTILAVPSRNEPFGRCVVEGMLAETPVVATRVGGIPEIISNEVDGLVVEPDDIDELAEALRRLLKYTHLVERLTAAAKVTACERFGFETYVSSVETIYRRAMKGKS